MKRIGMRELNQHASRVIEMVKRGEAVEITERNRPVARIVPVASQSIELDAAVADGRAVAPTVAGPIPMPPVIGDPSLSAADELARLRDLEPW